MILPWYHCSGNLLMRKRCQIWHSVRLQYWFPSSIEHPRQGGHLLEVDHWWHDQRRWPMSAKRRWLRGPGYQMFRFELESIRRWQWQRLNQRSGWKREIRASAFCLPSYRPLVKNASREEIPLLYTQHFNNYDAGVGCVTPGIPITVDTSEWELYRAAAKTKLDLACFAPWGPRLVRPQWIPLHRWRYFPIISGKYLRFQVCTETGSQAEPPGCCRWEERILSWERRDLLFWVYRRRLYRKPVLFICRDVPNFPPESSGQRLELGFEVLSSGRIW